MQAPSLPVLDNPSSRAVHAIIELAQRERGTWLAPRIARVHSPEVCFFSVMWDWELLIAGSHLCIAWPTGQLARTVCSRLCSSVATRWWCLGQCN